MSQNPTTGLEEVIPLRNAGLPIVGVDFSGGGGGAVMQSASWRYSFAKDGGAISTIALRGPKLPVGAIVYGGILDNITIPVGVGASIALQFEAANDLVSVAAISGAPWSTTGLKAIVPVMTAGSAIKGTAARAISMLISGAALTAGIFDLHVVYFMP